MESVIKTIRVFGRERKFEDVQGKERTCVFYSYTKDGKKFVQIKFPQSCENKPRKAGYFLLTFDVTNATYQKSKNPQFNDIVWINELVKYEEDVEYTKKLTEAKTKQLEDLFDSNTKDLPF